MSNQTQEVFSKVKKHLLSQNKRSVVSWSHGLNSAYYGYDGCKCSIGCLILPEFYSKTFEGYRVSRDFILAALKSSGIDVQSLPEGFLEDLQRLHDNREPDFWEQGLQEIAKQYGLEC